MHSADAVEHLASLENLPHFMSFIDEACRRLGADEDTAYALRLAVEEVCINLIHYGYKGMAPGPIRVSFHPQRDRITVKIADRAPPFDPADAPAPDLTSDADVRPLGGLGWYLVKRSVDHFDYQSDPEHGNVLTLTRRVQRTRQPTQGESSGTVG
jgi:serine/threonine-protein kinase RsbW